MMDALSLLTTAWQNILSHKLRSVLTTLGVMIGIGSLTTMVGIIEGINSYIYQAFGAVGSDLIYVTKSQWNLQVGRPDRKKMMELARRPDLTREDALAIQQLPSVAGAFITQERGGRTFRYRGKISTPDLYGIVEGYLSATGYDVRAGREILSTDTLYRRNVVVIGERVMKDLFGEQAVPERVLGAEIQFRGRRFVVVGVLAPRGKMLGNDLDLVAFIPYTTFRQILRPPRWTFGRVWFSPHVVVKVRRGVPLSRAMEDIEQLLRARRGLTYDQDRNFGLNTQEFLLSLYRQITFGVFAAMVGIASLALVVGGIGIMNIMLVSVAERTREIGIRMAVGATRRDILVQFLLEAVVLTALGGVLGLLLGVGLARLVDALTPLPARIPLWSVVLALVFSSFVGLFFGVYPARRAASMDPVEALRYE